jgi:hypothetical protein
MTKPKGEIPMTKIEPIRDRICQVYAHDYGYDDIDEENGARIEALESLILAETKAAISYCPNCNCMTHKVCGKCKGAETKELRGLVEAYMMLADQCIPKNYMNANILYANAKRVLEKYHGE